MCINQHGFIHLSLASGSAPHISVEGYQDGGIRVVCRSARWYPEPEVLWRDLKGQPLPSSSQTNSREASGLYETQTSIIITENSNQNLSCLVRNTHLSQEKESTLFYISDPFFPKVNPWMVTMYVILVVLFGSFGLSAYLFKIKDCIQAPEGVLGFIDSILDILACSTSLLMVLPKYVNVSTLMRK
ncbi:butyrophilin subfamily 1 member A1-like [Chelydra serpentina]|uniref:Butyrophilin subfamily 1 member A1-like n=1 Tax=Chelydra serpentina TaxID=8475 RepID=A0A8T1RXB3_CHESE|nr:butyrophilin subfamily 1 member A1-like [Chelydra serpentina]